MSSDDIVTLIGHLAWPLTVIGILVFLRRQIADVIRAIATRINDRNTEVAIGREGLRLTTRVAALEANAETQQIKSGVLATLTTAQAGFGAAPIPEELHDLAKSYRSIRERDYRERLRQKNDLADAMGALVLRQNVNRAELAAANDEALTLALATAVLTLPKDGDDDLLLQAGRGVDKLHVRYRVTSAFGQLIQSELLRVDRAGEAEELLSSYEKAADGPLRRRIDRTVTALRAYARDPSG